MWVLVLGGTTGREVHAIPGNDGMRLLEPILGSLGQSSRAVLQVLEGAGAGTDLHRLRMCWWGAKINQNAKPRKKAAPIPTGYRDCAGVGAAEPGLHFRNWLSSTTLLYFSCSSTLVAAFSNNSALQRGGFLAPAKIQNYQQFHDYLGCMRFLSPFCFQQKQR